MTEYVDLADALESIVDDGLLVTDVGLLASALVRPSMSVFGADAYSTIWLKAAAQLESLARNHTLFDGNKRTAMVLTSYFLALNGWDWQESASNEEFMKGVATGAIGMDESAVYLESHSVSI